MIKVTNLTKYYGNKKAVDNISFELEDGKIYGFLGPNGAGKSTTMNIMTGYIGATSGTVQINGFDIMEEPEKAKLNIGYLPELPPLYQDMTIDEYLTFVAELKKVPRRERKDHVAEIVKKAGLETVHSRLIKYLSKGYKQRVGLAGALISYPDVIILDEPTVGLDPLQINEMRDLIRSLKNDHTVILSSHIMQEVSAVCDNILIIVNGKIVANDRTEDLIKRFTASNNTSTTISYKFKADKLSVRKTLENVAEIETIKIRDNENYTIAEITTKADADETMNSIFFACANNKIPILESNVNKKSLEDIFISFAENKVEPIIVDESTLLMEGGNDNDSDL